MPVAWRQAAERGRQSVHRTVELPYLSVKKMFSEHCAPPSLTADLLLLGIEGTKSEQQVMWAGSAMYGGMYFTVSWLHLVLMDEFFLAGTETVCQLSSTSRMKAHG